MKRLEQKNYGQEKSVFFLIFNFKLLIKDPPRICDSIEEPKLQLNS